jgi:DNA polymerase III sliding clamp (beta) subunit (PCNA family)
MTKDINNYVVLGITNDGINIQSWETDKGEAQTMISAKCKWADVTIWLNGKHIADFCRMIDSENMQINIVWYDKPIIINDISDTHYKCVIRPLVK